MKPIVDVEGYLAGNMSQARSVVRMFDWSQGLLLLPDSRKSVNVPSHKLAELFCYKDI